MKLTRDLKKNVTKFEIVISNIIRMVATIKNASNKRKENYN